MQLLGQADDSTGAALAAGSIGLDLQAMFEELGVEPVVTPRLAPHLALQRATGLMDQHRSEVPLGVWSRLQQMRSLIGS